MPEGHTIHRAARLQRRRFAGRHTTSSSPQGRFDQGAARISGQTLRRVQAHGKHLFYEFDGGDFVHVHLGLFGKFRVSRMPAPAPSPNCRWLMETDTDQLHLAGPTVCELIDADAVEKIVTRLGPDPLAKRPVGDAVDHIQRRLSRRSIPIGAALLDQGVIAGLGNVYRSEILFLIGIHPFTPANEVGRAALSAIWSESVRLLAIGERLGRIVTVDPAEVGRMRERDVKRWERLYCYHRDGQPCRRCGDTIRMADVDGRNVWWCPTEQPA